MKEQPKQSWIYGIHAVERLLKGSPERVEKIIVQRGRQDAAIESVEQQAEKHKIPVSAVERKEIDKIAPGVHQGVAALCEARQPLTEKQLWPLLEAMDEPLLILILDGVTDPHNLGACLRTAEAAGVNAVLVPKDKSVGLTPVVEKVACGAVELVPFVQVTNLARVMDRLKEQGVWIVGTDDEAPQTMFELDYRGSIAMIMGSEGKGLRRLTKENCDWLASIPMAGQVESLNVSVATGICLYEAVRQRMAE